jgi:hypothetical protein
MCNKGMNVENRNIINIFFIYHLLDFKVRLPLIQLTDMYIYSNHLGELVECVEVIFCFRGTNVRSRLYFIDTRKYFKGIFICNIYVTELHKDFDEKLGNNAMITRSNRQVDT